MSGHHPWPPPSTKTSQEMLDVAWAAARRKTPDYSPTKVTFTMYDVGIAESVEDILFNSKPPLWLL